MSAFCISVAVRMMCLGGKMGVGRSFVVWKCFVVRQCSTPRATQMTTILLTQFQVQICVYANTHTQIHLQYAFHTVHDGYILMIIEIQHI